VLSAYLSNFICSQILWKNIRDCRNQIYFNHYIAHSSIFTKFFIHRFILACVTKETKKSNCGINILNIKLEFTVEPYGFCWNFWLFYFSRLDWPSSRLVSHPLKYVHDDPYNIHLAYSTGTTLSLTSKSLLTYIKRIMYKRLTYHVSFERIRESSGHTWNCPEKKVAFSFRSREKISASQRLRNYTYDYMTLSSEFHNRSRSVFNFIFALCWL